MTWTGLKHGSSGSKFINAKTGTIEAKIFETNMNMDRSFTGIKKGMKELMENNQRAHFQFKKQILINSGKAHDCDLIFVWESLKGCWIFQPQTLTPHSMAMGNLNKSKETTHAATTALKIAPYRTIINKN